VFETSHGGDKKNLVLGGTKDLFGKKRAKRGHILRTIFFLNSPFRKYFPEEVAKNKASFLNISTFPSRPLAKFGSFLLWMIASSPTSQN
jgi:hypothetical protein